jgi:PTH1 family peptidyl-tRNA hydrolase
MKWLLSFQNAAPKQFLIVGLGNPGSEYEHTRHNVGFNAVRALANKQGISFKKKRALCAELGIGSIGSSKIYLCLPLTYMNRSGETVVEGIKHYKVPLEHTVVIVDDIALDVGDIRLKEKGSHGGHNGLKSIEYHLKTERFPRLRIGVGHPQGKNLADYVLSPFEKNDEKKLTQVFNKVAEVLECWVTQGIAAAMTLANTKKS